MNHHEPINHRGWHLILTAAMAAMSTTLACHAPAAQAARGNQPGPDLSTGAAQFPDDDAIILRWDQHWTVEKDGTVHRRDHRWMKLLNSRPIRRYADPRLDFVNGREELIIHTARTHLPDGTILPVPDYSFNIVGPDDVAGWPQYADWQQMVVSFGGIEPGAVLELDYELVTPAGVLSWIDADLHVREDYPIVERLVAVTVPEGVTLSHQFDDPSGPDSGWALSVVDGPGTKQYRWVSRNLPGARQEPQSPPRHRQRGRLRFSTCPSATKWASTILDPVNSAAQSDDTIKQFAEATIKDEADPTERVHQIAKKLRDSFNVVSSRKTMRSLQCRPAAEVLRSNYGNPLESAALLSAALRSLGMKPSLHVAVDATRWDSSDRMAPTESAFAGVVVAVDRPDGMVFVHPQHGPFRNPGHWGRHRLLSVDAAGSLEETYVYARGEERPSELQIVGRISVGSDGEATGQVRIQATGLFFDPAKLETDDAQKALIAGLVERLLSDFEVSDHSVATLSERTFRATASVATKESLRNHKELHVLRFGEGPVFLADVPMPLARSYRRADVQLAGRFRESVDVVIELPEKCTPSILPAEVAPVEGRWGAASQTVEVTDSGVRLRRNVTVTLETLTPDDFEELRLAVNDLRASQSLLLAFSQSSQPD